MPDRINEINGTASTRVTVTDSLAVVRAALEAAECRGSGSDWQCPAHEDERRSLSVRRDGDKTLIKCHAGCETRDVLVDLGLTMADLFDRRREAPAWSQNAYPARIYPYKDESGTLLYTVHRSAQKRFTQQHADGAWSLGDVRRVLFLLPEVLDALSRGVPVHLVEGEKDVEALHRTGVTATCNSGGAEGWRDELADSLKGASLVTVWRDQDPPGAKWATAVTASLERRGIPFRLVEGVVKAKGADAWDHLAAGYGIEDALPVDLTTTNAVTTAAVPAQRGTDTRTQVDIGSKATVTDWLRDEMGQGALSSLFLRDGLIVHTPRIGEDGYIPPTEGEVSKGIHPGPAQVRPVTQDGVKALVEVRYNVGKTVEDKKTGDKSWVRTLLPKEAVTSAVSAAQIGEGVPNMRELCGITHTPAMRPDGTVLDAPGYDAATGLLYLPEHGLKVPPVPQRPTAQQVKEAVELLLRPVEQFPFVEESHRANWLGLMMTPALRSLLPPPYQMGIATATNPGSGKGFLMGMIRVVHGGILRGEMPREAEELRKSIHATLIDTTAPAVQFDNLRGVIQSSVLEALLTSATVSDRVLGLNKTATMTNDRLWLATGNNVKIGGDLPRRCLFVAIDPKTADPHLRTGFKLHPLRWIEENRGAYLAAILTVTRAWVLAGSPADITRSDDFAQWHGALRGMLRWAGVPGLFGGDSTDISAASEDDAEWSDFLAALHRVFAGKPFTASDVVGKIGTFDTSGIRPELLPGDLAEKHGRMAGSGSLTKSLGKWLSNRDGRYADGWVCKGHKSGKKATTYTVFPPADYVAEPAGESNPFESVTR